jgi:hypothetical protein
MGNWRDIVVPKSVFGVAIIVLVLIAWAFGLIQL